MQLHPQPGRRPETPGRWRGGDDLAVVPRIVWTCILRASPRRAWLTLSMCLETALRRPRALRDAVTLALMHKHLYEYMQETSKALDGLIRELREAEPAP